MGVICQFSASLDRPTLKNFVPIPEVYPAGRLDTDSEGLVLLTNDGSLQAAIANPRHKWPKCYWVQVEGDISEEGLHRLRSGVTLADGLTLPADVERMEPAPELWERTPPIRLRKTIPTSWIKLTLQEGRNRQVRRMTAHVGYPTLRLIRWAIGPYDLDGLAPGAWKDVKIVER